MATDLMFAQDKVIEGIVTKINSHGFTVAQRENGETKYHDVVVSHDTTFKFARGVDPPRRPWERPRENPFELKEGSWVTVTIEPRQPKTGSPGEPGSRVPVAKEITVRPGGCPEGPPCPK